MTKQARFQVSLAAWWYRWKGELEFDTLEGRLGVLLMEEGLYGNFENGGEE